MIFKLQQNDSETNRVDKTVTDLQETEGSLKAPCSIENPVLILKVPAEIAATCNYITIPEFKRSYFVTESPRSLNSDHWEFTCHVDVLSTYKVQLRQQTAVIARQENLYNLYLNDASFKTYQNPSIITKAFPAGFTTQNYVFAISGTS